MTVSLAAPLDRLLVGVVSRWLTARRRRGAGRPMAVFSQDTIGEAILLDGLYERGHLTALAEWLRAERPDALSGTAIDIGANIGNHACFFASLFERVIAFEPNPRVFRLLMLNTEERGNVEARNMGLSDAPRAARLAHPRNNTGGGRIVEDDSGVGITLDRLDAQITADTRIGLIKLDIEGHERAALEGAAETIARDRPIVVIEQHASEIDGGTSPTIDWLRAHGYTTFYSVEGPPMLRKRLRLRTEFRKRNHPMIVAECATPAREGRQGAGFRRHSGI